MTFKINKDLTNDVSPVIETSKSQQVFSCAEFTGKYSSITGIQSKFLYIGKINEITGEPENPIVRIVCGSECIDKCINFNKEEK